jgi:hypothetical protein
MQAIPPTVKSKVKNVNRKLSKHISGAISSESGSHSDEVPSPRQLLEKTKKSRAKKAGVVAPNKQASKTTDDELFTMLRTCIVGDEELYLRVLRYEVCNSTLIERMINRAVTNGSAAYPFRHLP